MAITDAPKDEGTPAETRIFGLRPGWLVLLALLGLIAIGVIDELDSQQVCVVSQEQVEGYMVEYLQAHRAGNEKRKGTIRRTIRATIPDCAAPVAAAASSWMDAVDDDNQAKMNSADNRFLDALAELD